MLHQSQSVYYYFIIRFKRYSLTGTVGIRSNHQINNQLVD